MLAEAASCATDRSQVIAALKQASAETGSDFHYLLGTAMRESSLKPQAQSSTSSAAGLFQFVGQTWLGLIKQNGAKYGLGSSADAISQDGDGRFHVDNAADRQAILALRKDPRIAALMAGEYVNQSRSVLESSLGRDVCDGELYAAHFLGPSAACRLIQLSASHPDADAADAFPQAADANRNVFYRNDGTPKTVREVYNWALKQPAAAGAERAVASSAAHASRRAAAPSAAMPDAASAFLSTVMSWSPRLSALSSFDSTCDKQAPVSPFLLTPGVMDVLSAVTPARPSHG